MKRWDVVAAALEHAIPPQRLHLAAVRAGAHATGRWIAANLSAQPPVEILLDGGRLVLAEGGITAVNLQGGDPVEVSWEEIAACLLAVVTPDLIDGLDPNVDETGDTSTSSADRRVETARRRLAHRVARANALASPSTFAAALRERTILDETSGARRWPARITLDPVDPDHVVCRLNGHLVARLAAGAAPFLVEVDVPSDPPSTVDAAPADAPTFRRIVCHQHFYEAPRSLPPCFADRVDAGPVRYTANWPFWSLQVDGELIVHLGADAFTGGGDLTVFWSVYDHGHYPGLEPHRGQCALPRPSPSPGPPGAAFVPRRRRLRRVGRGGRGR